MIDTLTYIEINTGLEVSYKKTTLYRIGSIANTNAKLYTKKQLRWSNDVINTLGFNLYHNNFDENLNQVIIKLKTVAKLWYYRHLILMGKVMVINTLLYLILIYRLQFLHWVSDEKFDDIEECIKNFLWHGK